MITKLFSIMLAGVLMLIPLIVTASPNIEERSMVNRPTLNKVITRLNSLFHIGKFEKAPTVEPQEGDSLLSPSPAATFSASSSLSPLSGATILKKLPYLGWYPIMYKLYRQYIHNMAHKWIKPCPPNNGGRGGVGKIFCPTCRPLPSMAKNRGPMLYNAGVRGPNGGNVGGLLEWKALDSMWTSPSIKMGHDHKNYVRQSSSFRQPLLSPPQPQSQKQQQLGAIPPFAKQQQPPTLNMNVDPEVAYGGVPPSMLKAPESLFWLNPPATPANIPNNGMSEATGPIGSTTSSPVAQSQASRQVVRITTINNGNGNGNGNNIDHSASPLSFSEPTATAERHVFVIHGGEPLKPQLNVYYTYPDGGIEGELLLKQASNDKVEENNANEKNGMKPNEKGVEKDVMVDGEHVEMSNPEAEFIADYMNKNVRQEGRNIGVQQNVAMQVPVATTKDKDSPVAKMIGW